MYYFNCKSVDEKNSVTGSIGNIIFENVDIVL